MSPGQALLAAGVVAAMALAGCGPIDSPGPADSAGSLGELCRARAAAPAEVEAHVAEVHQQLHRLAGELEQRDRAAAADLLRAKQAVESTLAQPPEAREAMDGKLRALIEAVRRGRRVLDRAAPDCDTLDVEGG
jgi:ABC-type transporter Mla subunit MlaD